VDALTLPLHHNKTILEDTRRCPAMNHPADTQHFRFFDNREKYPLFVTTCSEKWVIAERVGMKFKYLQPKPPALRVFEAGMGDATILSQVLRHLHDYFPTIPLPIVGKES
jgi:hypothetical protein